MLGKERKEPEHMRTSTVALIVLALATAPLRAQAEKPAALALAGDPAQDLDLGAGRLVPMPVRTQADGPIDSAPYYALHAVQDGDQVLPEGKPKRPRRLLGHDTAAVMPWLRRLDAKAKPTILWSNHWTIVSFLKDSKVTDLTPQEGIRLRAFFPKLRPRGKLTGRQRAHLWAIRMLRTQSAVADLLDLDPNGRLKADSHGAGYRPLRHRSCELYLFSNPLTLEAFHRHIFKPDTRAIVGEVLGSGPVSAILLDDAPSDALRRRFVHTAAFQLIRTHRRMEGGIPDWISLGLSHYFERRQLRLSKKSKDEARTLPDTKKTPRDWNQAVRDLVAGGRAGELGALSATPGRGLTTNTHLQSWSLVKYLLGIDPKRFGKLCSALLHTRPGITPQESLRRALKAAYGHYPEDVEKGWKAWVLKGSRRK